MYVENFFQLDETYLEQLATIEPRFGYNGYGEIVYYRTYSRKKPKDEFEANLKSDFWTGQENWHDSIARVINGTFSIRKDHYVRNRIPWNDEFWQKYAFEFGRSLCLMHWMPPGRGMWAMGTPFVYERGSMALYNCAFTNLTSTNLADDLEWLMDSLMVGVGVGWYAERAAMICHHPRGTYQHIIGDSREEWAKSVKLLVLAYTVPNQRLPIFDCSQIREKGKLIKGFGGLASGPEPLIKLHDQIKKCFLKYMHTANYDIVQLKSDLANLIGCCVVAGNVRRSAEIGLGWITDPVFLDLKDYEKHPERESFGWMSNNTVMCEDDEHFELLGEVARRVPIRGEPGIANLKNFPKGRLNGKNETRWDNARGANPCGEITLEHRETCNVVETVPTNCPTVDDWYRACEYATFYSSTVSLLPTHQPSTNAVVTRNRRIGVGIIDFTGWVNESGMHNVIRYLRKGYEVVSSTNKSINAEAGIPEAIKKTTIKPGGTIPKLPGKTPGAGYPTFDYTLRRTRIATNHPMVPLLQDAGIPMEPEVNDPLGTLVFEYPIHQKGSKPAEKATLWEQAMNIVTLQREWSDNAVSNTLYFKPKWVLERHVWTESEIDECLCDQGLSLDQILIDNYPKEYFTPSHKVTLKYYNGKLSELKVYNFNPEHEEDDIEAVTAAIVPLIKMISFLPHSAAGVYAQMPEEGISKEEYDNRLASISKVEWWKYQGGDGEDEKYCQGNLCEIVKR